MLAVQRHRIRRENAAQAKHHIHFIQMVVPVVVADDLAQMRAAARDQPIIVSIAVSKGRQLADHGVQNVQQVGGLDRKSVV